MSSSYSTLKFELIGTGEASGSWGAKTNTNLGTAIEQAIVGMATLTSTDFVANVATLTLTNTSALQDARALCLNIGAGSLSAAGTLNVPAIEKPYIVINNDSYAVTVKVSGLTGVTVPAGKRTVVYNNGTDVGDQVNFLTSLALGTALPIASGGTAATTASGARTSLGATTIGGNFFTLANPSAIRFVQLNADNTITVMDAATFRAAIGAGSGGGSVTSVGGTGAVSGLTLTGTVTTTGNLTLGGTLAVTAADFASQTANTVLAAPNGAAGVPTFRVLAAADVPTLNQNTTGTAANVTGTVAVANGGSGTTTAQGAINTFAGAVTSGQYLRGNGTNVVMAAIQAGDVPTLNQNTTGTSANVTGTVAIANGGTGTVTPALVAGTNVTISGSWPNQTINATAGGTVTSVATGSGLTGGPITATGTINFATAYGDTVNPYASKSANFILAAPNGTAGVPSFRAVVAADIPTLNQNTTGTAANVTGIVAVANGGSAATTAQGAINTFAGAVTSGSYLRGNGTNVVMAAIQAGDVPTLNQNTTGTAANVTGTVAIANGGTGATTLAGASIATYAGTETLTNKRINPRVSTTTSTATLTPDVSAFDQYNLTAQAAGLTIAAPTGTPVDGTKLVLRILDNGTARALTWNATYTVIGVTLPTTTVVNKTTYVGCVYNANNTRWDVLAVATQA